MAISVSMAAGSPSSSTVGNQTMNFTVTVANTNSSAVTLQSLQVTEASSISTGTVRIGQPRYLTPNVPVGVGNPVLAATTGTASYGFQCVLTSPVLPGPSPQAPGGAAAVNAAQYPNADFMLQATAVTSDGSVSYGTLVVPVLSSEVPQSNGGALVLTQGFNLANLITL